MAAAHIPVTSIFGAVICAGVFALIIAPFFSKLVRFFPPLVTGTIIAIIGITLLRVGITWAGGGVLAKQNFGNPQYLGIVVVVLTTILLLNRISTGFISNVSVLIGLIIGFLVAIPAGLVNFDGVHKAPWFAIVYPFRFGRPTFDFASCVSICLVMIVVMVESTGMFLAMGEICDVKVGPDKLARGLAADGLGTIIGGLFNTFPYTSFSQNVGLVGITGVRSRYVVAVSGLILISLGLFPKMATIIASIPQPVLGGAGLCMFGMVAATGIKILSRVDFEKRHNLLIMAVSIAVGMIPLVSPNFFDKMPKFLDAIVHSGITLTAIVAVLLNTLFNGATSAADVDSELRATAAAASEH
jgi:NCS2 family nucleobase:cation symporter-2